MAFNNVRSPRAIYKSGLTGGARPSPRSATLSAGFMGYGSDRDSVTGRPRKVKAR